jgi:hypothetical protein
MLWVSEGLEVAMKIKLALPEVAFECGDKLATKDAAEHLNGKEEGVAWLNPVGKPISAPRCLGSRATSRSVSALVCSKRWYRIFLFCRASGASS